MALGARSVTMNLRVLVLAEPTEQPLRSYVPGERTAGEALAQLDCRPCLQVTTSGKPICAENADIEFNYTR